MTYRLEEITDLRAVMPELLPLMAACWREVAPGVRFDPRIDLLLRYADHQMIRFWGAFHEGALVGYLSGYVATCLYSGRTTATEDALYVLPRHRHLVGLALVGHVIAQLAAEGVQRVETTSRPDRRMQGFMRAAGFREIAATYERTLRH